MKRRKTPPPKRQWIPLVPAVPVLPSPEYLAALRAEAARQGADPAIVDDELAADRELWRNDRYTVLVRRHDEGWVTYLSVRRNDRKPDMPWRHLQRIKNELAGDEAEAVELFPAESRLVDTANQRWLWCLRPGDRVPVGFQTRSVTGAEEATRVGARQTPLET